MTSENAMYGPGWLKCGLCGVTQPAAALFQPLRLPDGGPDPESGHYCLDAKKCADAKVEVMCVHAVFARGK